MRSIRPRIWWAWGWPGLCTSQGIRTARRCAWVSRIFICTAPAAGAAGAMMAHAQRVLTGQGQYVDVSCQEAVARALASAPQKLCHEGAVIEAPGVVPPDRRHNVTCALPGRVKDGFVNFQFSGGAASGRSVNNLVRWMAEEGMGDAYLESLDFTSLGYGTITKEMLDRIVPPVERFMMSHTKQELFEGAVARRILLFPVATPGDIVHNPQLQARQYFQQVPQPDLGTR